MKYAIIENGRVKNIALADAPLADNWIDATGANIGDLWDGQTFTTPPPPVPDQVTNAQARIALILTPATDGQSAHLLAQAEAVFNALPEPDRSIALARMEYDTHWPRQSELVTIAQAALSLTDDQVDDLFRLAATK